MRDFRKELLDGLDKRLTDAERAALFEAASSELEEVIERHVEAAERRIKVEIRRTQRRHFWWHVFLAVVLAAAFAGPAAVGIELALKHEVSSRCSELGQPSF